MRHHALSAIGRDRPGIVAAVSEALLAHSVNIEDSQMTILRGHFTMMLVVAVPGDADVGALRADLDAVRAQLGLEALTLGELEDAGPAEEPVRRTSSRSTGPTTRASSTPPPPRWPSAASTSPT